MGDFLWASFLYVFEEENCCPVFLKVPVEMEGLLGLHGRRKQRNCWTRSQAQLCSALPSATCQYKEQPWLLPVPPPSAHPLSISLTAKVVATVAPCVLATFQAWAGHQEGPVPILRGPEVLQRKTHLSISLSSQPASQLAAQQTFTQQGHCLRPRLHWDCRVNSYERSSSVPRISVPGLHVFFPGRDRS